MNRFSEDNWYKKSQNIDDFDAASPYSKDQLAPEEQAYIEKAKSLLEKHITHSLMSAKDHDSNAELEMRRWESMLSKLFNGEIN